MNNTEYWDERMENALNLSEKQVTKPLKKLYRRTFDNIKSELFHIWLDMIGDGEVNQAALYRKNRMSNFQGLLSKELKSLGEINIEYMQTALYLTFQNGYADMDKFLGIKGTFSFLDRQVAEEIINQNYKGAVFSERIWKDIDKLRLQIEDSVGKAALQGKDVRKVTKELQERMNVSYSACKRATVTETGRVFNESCRKKAMDRGYLSYHILVESDACEDCIREFEGKHFSISESVLPLHPNYHCCLVIDID